MDADDSVGKYLEEISSDIPDANDRVQVINLIIRGRFWPVIMGEIGVEIRVGLQLGPG